MDDLDELVSERYRASMFEIDLREAKKECERLRERNRALDVKLGGAIADRIEARAKLAEARECLEYYRKGGDDGGSRAHLALINTGET